MRGSGAGRGGGRPAPGREIAVGLVVFAGYSAVAGSDWLGREQAARRHAHDVIGLERRLHVDVEPALNRWLAPHGLLRVLADYEYATTYVLSAFLLLLWLWLRRPDVYRPARSSFVLLNVLGIAGFLLYPLMPPRLVPDAGFVDTVRLGHTWGSWGSPLVGHANQLAAMPSLHFGWALWVSAVLAKVSGGRRTQVVSAVHVLVTLWVVLATANHYLLDALVATALVAVSVRLATGDRVPGADAFFLHVETPAAPQHVGGVVLLDATRGAPGREAVEELVRSRLPGLPRFRQVLVEGGRWRRARWAHVDELDLAWHVPLVDLAPQGGGPAAFDALVARLQEQVLPRDRPLWRLVVVHGIAPDRAGVVLLVHHVVADGIGTVAQALHLLEPELPPPDGSGPRPPGPLRTLVGTVVGLAQLATDGSAPSRLPAGSGRTFTTVTVPLARMQELARRHGARVSDVLLTAVAGALRAVRPDAPAQVRASVPLTLRDPRDAGPGNVTGAVLLDLPVGPAAAPDRLAEVVRRSARLRAPSRALAARAAMRGAGAVLPPVLHAWFARTVYGPRTFSAIVSNMPGPPLQLSLAGAPVVHAFPLLPLAPGVPLAVGSLGWNGTLCVGISADPALVPEAEAFGRALRAVVDELAAGEPALSRA